jgi:hypothetical protein
MKRSYHFNSPAQRGWTLSVSALVILVLVGVLWAAAESGGNARETVAVAEATQKATAKATPEAQPESIPETLQESGSKTLGKPPAASAVPEAAADEKPASTGQRDLPAAADARPSVPPVSVGQPAPVAPGVVTRVVKMEPVQGEAQLPGEVAGPAIRVTLEFSNQTNAPVDMSHTVVTLEYGPEAVPAAEFTGSGASDFPAEIAPGQTASAVLVFAVPLEQRDNIRFLVDHKLDLPIVVIEGPAPRG